MTKEQEAAKYIQERLKLENLASDNLVKLLKSAALKIAQISAEYSIAPSNFKFSANAQLKKRIDAVIEELVEAIIADARTIVLNGEEDDERKSAILAWFTSAFLGKTFRQRVSKHIRLFAAEMEESIATAKKLGYSAPKTASLVGAYISAPYNSPLLSGSSAKHSGTGTYASAYKNLDRAVTDQVARTVQRKFYEFDHAGTTIWQVIRGSSYPCSLCDSSCGIVTNITALPPFHPHCCCIAIPLD